MIDVTHEINAVSRQVGRRTLDAGEVRTVTVGRTYPSPIDEVWDACTNPERIPRWFLPVSGELRVGGRYQLEGNAGGTVERCDPPRGFLATWEFAGAVSWIELRLEALPDGSTRFALDHLSPVEESEHWTRYGPGAVGVGWDLALLGLGLHLPAGADVDPAAFEAWSISEDGRRFATLSSRAWGDAHVASGEGEDQAHAAAERTAAFYTGAEPTS